MEQTNAGRKPNRKMRRRWLRAGNRVGKTTEKVLRKQLLREAKISYIMAEYYRGQREAAAALDVQAGTRTYANRAKRRRRLGL